MKSPIAWIVLVLVLLGAGAGYYFWAQDSRRPPLPVSAPPAATPPQAQAPRFPVPEVAVEKPLPALRDSDATMLDGLGSLLGSQALASFIRPESLVRHIVVTVDNLPRQTFAPQMSPVNPPGGQLRTSGKGEELVISPQNSARYTPYVKLAEAVDTKKAVALYTRFYPLFQQAYLELGFPGAYFNDRLVTVIDHLLETPEVQGPIKLVVSHVLPEFADPTLQERSQGQKLLLRMGPENAARVKAKLRELRSELVAR